MIRGTALAVFLVLVLAGCEASGPADEMPATRPSAAKPQESPPPLAEDLDASAFRAALVGEWVSVWAHPSGRYLSRLTLRPDGEAVLEYVAEDREGTVSGSYTVSFLRPPDEGATTLAQIAIEPSDGPVVVLSRVNFGLHNAVLASEGLLLRIAESPFGSGVLRRAVD